MNFSNLSNSLSHIGAIGGNGSTGSNIVNIQSLLNGLSGESANPNYQMVNVCKTSDDILHLSCTWKRIKEEADFTRTFFSPPTKLLDNILFENVKPVDKEQARKIRDYYSKKIMMWKLLSKPLTMFRQDLNKFICGDGTETQEKQFGMIYYLPYFYEYDIGLDELMDKHNVKVTDYEKNKLGTPVTTKTLKLQQTFYVNRRALKRKEYWFSDESDNLVKLNVLKDNPLMSLLDVHTIGPIKISGKFIKTSLDNKEYLDLKNYRFV